MNVITKTTANNSSSKIYLPMMTSNNSIKRRESTNTDDSVSEIYLFDSFCIFLLIFWEST